MYLYRYSAERGTWDEVMNTFINSDGDPTQFASIPAAAWFVIVTPTSYPIALLRLGTLDVGDAASASSESTTDPSFDHAPIMSTDLPRSESHPSPICDEASFALPPSLDRFMAAPSAPTNTTAAYPN
ncbi:hypothetical protein D9611_008436 [Ephemerocybe angulata]|uniref:Uncharacterized protein n=1 Tax=Ephemerocybe angulata TaxID=980116 RepID=A0A8H5F524_9AGAR|nr:hypothetical protein D9611_008436 [Tulosesus angulatus]